MAKAPLLSKYLEAFEKDPSSKVFAPLAESYRRLGMIKDAKNILNKGLQFHPKYVPGLITLAHCHYDEGQFLGAFDILKPLISEQYENYTLQRLFAFTCYQLGKKEEALETFKFLLFINPKDTEAADKVAALEKLINPIVKTENKSTENLFNDENSDEDQWSQVDFSSVGSLNNSPVQTETQKSVEDEYFEKNEPVITHTLVNLYLDQKLYGKALEVLERILELAPDDEATKNKYEEVKALIGHDSKDKSLMDIYDEKFGDESEDKEDFEEEIREEEGLDLSFLEQKYSFYLEQLRDHAQKIQVS